MTEALTRIKAHIKNLRENGAPHQQLHANDLEEMVGLAETHSPEALTVNYDELLKLVDQLRKNVLGALEERDEARRQAAEAVAARDTALARVAELEPQIISDLTAPGPLTGSEDVSKQDSR